MPRGRPLVLSEAEVIPYQDEAAWKQIRRQHIGASEAAAVLGASNYMTPLELYYRKRGELPEVTETTPMRVGKALEPIVRELYQEQTGNRVVCDQWLLVSKAHPFMAATLDGAVEGTSRLVELKTAHPRSSGEWGEPGTDEVPVSYLLQVQHQMIVAGAEAADIAVLIGNADFRVYTVPRHDVLCERIIEAEAEFWEAVKTGKPPKEQPTDAAVLARIAPKILDTIDLSDNPEAAADIEVYRSIGAEIKRLEEARNLAKYRLIRSMAHYESARVGGLELRRTLVRKKEHTVKATEYIQFSIKQAKDKTNGDGNDDSGEDAS